MRARNGSITWLSMLGAGLLSTGVAQARPAVGAQLELGELGARLDGPGAAPSFALELVAWGASGGARPAAAPCRAETRSRTEYRREGLVEWYRRAGGGLQHGFDLLAPPAAEVAETELVLRVPDRFTVEVASSGRSARFRSTDGREAIAYGGLLAWDADGRELEARMVPAGSELVLRVDTRCARWPVTVDPYLAVLRQVLPGPPSLHQYGWSAARSGAWLAVGEYGDPLLGANAGAVHTYVRTGSTWMPAQVLRAADGEAGDRFGISVALRGDLLVVGAVRQPPDPEPGSAYVFERTGTTWSETAHLVPPPGSEGIRFGTAVAISDDRTHVVVGAPYPGGTIYVFGRLGDTWLPEVSLTSPLSYVFGLGTSLAMDGEWLVAGAPGSNHALVWRTSGGFWTFVQRLQGAYPDHGFGTSVAVDGNRLACGAPLVFAGGGQAGAVYVLAWSGTAWEDEAYLRGPAPVPSQGFGTAVALDGSRVLVSDLRGDIHLFSEERGAWAYELALPRTLEPAPESLTFDGNEILAGCIYGTEAFEITAAEVGTACFGDGTGAACPCGNAGGPGEGCAHTGGHGSRIAATGTPSLASDDLVMTVTQLQPGNTGLFYSGTVPIPGGTPVFDGLQCVGGDVRRYRGLFQTTGTSSDTSFVAQDPSGTYFAAGTTYTWQHWSRDVVNGPSPCGTQANFSPALSVQMTP